MMKKTKLAASVLALSLVCATAFSVIPVQALAQNSPKQAAESQAPADTMGEKKEHWEIKHEDEKSITLGEYKGTAVNVVIPSKIEGKQVYLTKFPGAPAPGQVPQEQSDGPNGLKRYTSMTPEQKKIVSVVTKSVDGTKVMPKSNADDNTRCTFGADLNSSGDDVKDSLTYVDLSAFDMSKWTALSAMFRNRYNLQTIKGLESWDTSNINDMKFMFEDVPSEDVKNVANWNVSKVTSMQGMFHNTKISTEDLKNWKVESVTNTSNMFTGCKNVSDLTPLANWNMSKVTDASCMFNVCKNIKDLSPLAGWNVSSMTEEGSGYKGMYGMFQGTSVEDVSPLNKWDVSKVVSMRAMFQNTPVKTANLPNWKTDSLKYTDYMFSNTQITDTTGISSWNVSNVIKMQGMFANTPLVFADLSGWKLNANVENDGMFKTAKETSLLVVAQDETFGAHKFAADNRVGVHPTFKVDGQVVGNPETHIVLKDGSKEAAQKILQAEMDKLNPTKPGYHFVKWVTKDPTGNAFEILSAVYEAEFAENTKQVPVKFVDEENTVLKEETVTVSEVGNPIVLNAEDLNPVIPEGYKLKDSTATYTVAYETKEVIVPVVKVVSVPMTPLVPATPVEPSKPTEPSKPADPTTPATPSQPTTPGNSVIPQTGDNTQLMMLAAVAAVSLAGVASLILLQKKKGAAK